MKQPDLGKKISELRKQKGFTQEELVEKCNINVRTIQRIEAGDVTPRSFTVKTILEALGINASEFFEKSIHEEDEIHLSDKDRTVLSTSWIAGIFVTITSVIGMIIESLLMSDWEYYENDLFLRAAWCVPFLISLFFFLRGYKKIGDVFKNSTLTSASYAYFFIELVIVSMTISFSIFDYGDYFSDILFGIISALLMGVAELVLGLGIYKLRDRVGSFAQIVGILKMVNGGMFITILLFPVAGFLMIPVLIMEIILIYTTAQKIRE